MRIVKQLWIFQALLIVTYFVLSYKYFVSWCGSMHFEFSNTEFILYAIANLLIVLGVPALNQFYLIDRLIKGRFVWIFILIQIAGLYLSMYLNALLDAAFLKKYNPDWLMSADHINSRFFINFAFIGLLSIQKFIATLYVKMDSEKKLKINQLESDIKLLRSQINPHFLFNSLNNIYSYAIQKKDETPDLILKLSDILRFLSDSKSNTLYITAEKEIAVTKNLFDLYLVNKRWLPKVSFSVEKNDTDLNAFYIEPHSILTLAENAFKHCNLDEENAFIRFHIKVGATNIECTSENSIRSDKKQQSEGTGLTNLQKRLQLSYNNDFIFTVQNQNDIFKAYLKTGKLENKVFNN